MKKLFLLLNIILLSLSAYSQTKLEKDIISAKSELYIRGDSTIIEVIRNNSPASVTTGSGVTVSGNQTNLVGTLSQDAPILGAGYDMSLGTNASRLSTMDAYSSTRVILNTNGYIQFTAGSNTYYFSGGYFYNTATGDTIATLDNIDELIEYNREALPLNFDYQLNSSITDQRPGVGKMRFNNANPINVTQIYIDDFDINSIDKSTFIQLADTGSYFYITEKGDNTNAYTYEIIGIIDASGYTKYNVNYIKAEGTIPASLVKIGIVATSGGSTFDVFDYVDFDTLGLSPTFQRGRIYFDSTKNALAIQTIDNKTVYLGDTLFADAIQLGGSSTIIDSTQINVDSVVTEKIIFGDGSYLTKSKPDSSIYSDTSSYALKSDSIFTTVTGDIIYYNNSISFNGSTGSSIDSNSVTSDTLYYNNAIRFTGVSGTAIDSNSISADTVKTGVVQNGTSFIHISPDSAVIYNIGEKAELSAGYYHKMGVSYDGDLAYIIAGNNEYDFTSSGATFDDFMQTDTLKSTVITGDNLFLNLGTTQKAGAYDKGTSSPIHTDRTNYDGYFHATGLYGILNSYTTTGNASVIGSERGTIIDLQRSGTLTNNNTNNAINISNTLALNGFNNTGAFIKITDNPTGSGLNSGKVLSATIGATERISLNPRSTRTGTAYIIDTDSLLTSGSILSVRNQGNEIFNVSSGGVSVGGGDVMTTSDTVDGKIGIQSVVFDSLRTVKIKLDTSSTTHSEGSIIYDAGTRSYVGYNDISGFSHNLGYENVRRVWNETGATIPNGRALRKVGTYVDGDLIASVALAGNSSWDSLPIYGIATVDIPNNSYGIATVSGNVRDLDLSAYNDTLAFLGFAGVIIDTCPPPKYICQPIGEIIYADNDSGLLDVRIKEPTYYPSPQLVLDTSSVTATISIASSGVWYYIPISNSQNRKSYGLTVVGDSVRCDVTGDYEFIYSFSFSGNPATEDWDYGFFINNNAEFYKSRTTNSSNTGDGNVQTSRRLNEGDYVSVRIRNNTGAGDPTIEDQSFQIIFKNR